MARVSNPLIGHSRNKIGGVVFSTWKGINTLREKPASVANPRTPAQVSQRSAFAQMVAMGRQVLGALQVSFRQQAVQMSQFNAFMQANILEAFTIAGALATFVPSELRASKGSLVGFEALAFSGLTGRDLAISWDDNSGTSGANATDAVHIMVVSSDGLSIVDINTGDTRQDNGTIVTVPGAWSLVGARAAVYFVKADGTESSDSENIATA